jgi:RNA polymerase sigma-70 factor (ECF subfamily)
MPNPNLVPLLERCLDGGEQHVWEEFIRAAQPFLASGVMRALGGWSPARRAEIDDLVQESFVRLCANDCRALRNFRAADSNALCVYLRTVAASVATDHLRSVNAQKHGSGQPAVSLDDLSREPAAGHDTIAAIERKMLMQLIDRCLQSQSERDRAIFWLYHRQGLTPKAISGLTPFALAQRGVETILYRLTAAVRDCVQGLMQNKSASFEGAAG